MSNEIIRRISVLNAYFHQGKEWRGSVTVSNQVYDQKKGHMVDTKDPDTKYLDIVHVGERSFSFPDLNGESHLVDLMPCRAKINELFKKLKAIDKPFLTTEKGQDQWHLPTTADHPENYIVLQAGDYMIKLSCMLYKNPGDEKRSQKFLGSIWKNSIQSTDEDFEF